MDRIPNPDTVFLYGTKLALIYLSRDPQNPRTDVFNCTTMWCWHKRYNLGDEGGKPREGDFRGWEEIADYIRSNHGDALLLIQPLYLIDHSGISISTGSFRDRWDSGQVGFIFVTDHHYVEAMGETNDSIESKRAWAEKVIAQEVELYDTYLQGLVYFGELLDLDNPGGEREMSGDYYGYKHRESGLLQDLLGAEAVEGAEELGHKRALEAIRMAAEKKGVEFYGWR